MLGFSIMVTGSNIDQDWETIRVLRPKVRTITIREMGIDAKAVKWIAQGQVHMVGFWLGRAESISVVSSKADRWPNM